MLRKIIHCDADCFFVALEIRDDESLKGIPVAVGGAPERRGVISTCNYEARAFGVRSAMASGYAKKLCPQLIILPHNHKKYKVAARQMREIFSDYSSSIEPLSLDEAYLDVSESLDCLGSATLIGKEIRRRIKKEIGITASVGVASNKFLAKVGSEWDKPDGLTIITPSRAKIFLKSLPIESIPGVGPTTAKKLRLLGLNTCGDIQKTDIKLLNQSFSQFGQTLYEFSHGEDNRPVKTLGYRKSMSVERTYTEDLAEKKLCYSRIDALHNELLKRLSAYLPKQLIQKYFIKVKFNDFHQTTMEKHESTISACKFRQLFDLQWESHQKPVRLLGVGVRLSSPMIEKDVTQSDLFQNTVNRSDEIKNQ